MASWICCLLVACCLSLLHGAPIIARSLSFPRKVFQADLTEQSEALAILSKEALLAGNVANEPDPDSADLGFYLRGKILPFASETQSEIAMHDEERPTKFAEFEPALHDEESSISSLLNQNGLPIGLLPSCVENYTLSDAGLFSVSLQKSCYVDFDYEVYYAQTITGTLSYGSISDLSGIQAKKAFIWLSVTGIRTDSSSSSYIYFDVGPISKRLSISQFQTIPLCKAKAMDFSALA